jgi:hypothetical protein
LIEPGCVVVVVVVVTRTVGGVVAFEVAFDAACGEELPQAAATSTNAKPATACEHPVRSFLARVALFLRPFIAAASPWSVECLSLRPRLRRTTAVEKG